MPVQPWEADWRTLVKRVRAGKSLRPKSWPGNADFAVALSFDCDHETFELGQGKSTVGRLAWGEFGRRQGVPRILKVLERSQVPATFFYPAVSALIDPDEPRRVRDMGHEIGMHGWIHENNSLLDSSTERDLMLRARETLEEITSVEMSGFRSANWDLSPSTIPLVAELELSYDSSLMADDDCYELMLDGTPTGIVEIPVEWIRDDAVYFLFNREPATRPWMAPKDVLDVFLRELEGAASEHGVFQLVMHPFVVGYRSRIWILESLIERARELGKPWFTTHADLARHVASAE